MTAPAPIDLAWAQWCQERPARYLAIRRSLRRGDLTLDQVKAVYPLIECDKCGERHR